MIRSALVTLLVLVMTGCSSSYPIKKDGLLSSPVEFSYKHFRNPELSRDEAIAEVRSRLNDKGLLTDRFAKEAFENQIPLDYEVVTDSPQNEIDYLAQLVKASFLGTGGAYDSMNNLFAVDYGQPQFGYEQVSVSSQPDGKFELKVRSRTGTFQYIIGSKQKPGPYSSGDVYTGTAELNMTISGSYEPNKSGVSTGKFANVSYQLDCGFIRSQGQEVPNPADLVKVNDSYTLLNRLKGVTNVGLVREIDVVDKLVNQFTARANRRYQVSDEYAPGTFEVKHSIDFATAKARIQRSLGGKAVNESQSMFTIDKWHSQGRLQVRHQFWIALFPDRKNTAVQFSGRYKYLTDAFGGPNLFGPDVYKAEMDELVQQVNRILK